MWAVVGMAVADHSSEFAPVASVVVAAVPDLVVELVGAEVESSAFE